MGDFGGRSIILYSSCVPCSELLWFQDWLELKDPATQRNYYFNTRTQEVCSNNGAFNQFLQGVYPNTHNSCCVYTCVWVLCGESGFICGHLLFR